MGGVGVGGVWQRLSTKPTRGVSTPGSGVPLSPSTPTSSAKIAYSQAKSPRTPKSPTSGSPTLPFILGRHPSHPILGPTSP